MNSRSNSHLYWVDVVRVVAIFLVIVIHVAARIVDRLDQYPLAWWQAANVYDSLARISVPLFFMVSGMLLLPVVEEPKLFFTKRMNKVLVPFIAWSIIYLLWNIVINRVEYNRIELLQNIFVTGISGHLWFLYPLIGLYLITPIIRLLIQPENKNLLWYFVFLWFLFEPVESVLIKFYNISLGIHTPVASGFVGYFLLGYLLKNAKPGKTPLFLAIITWGISVLTTIYGTQYLSINAGELVGYFYNYLSLNVVTASIAAFLLLKWSAETPIFTTPHIQTAIQKLSKASFGIYLIHIIVMEVLSGKLPYVHLKPQMGNPVWTIPLVSIAIFIVSYIAVSILRKIPVIKNIVP